MRVGAGLSAAIGVALMLTGCGGLGGGFDGSYCESNGGEDLLRFDFEGDEVRISGMGMYSRTVGMGLKPYEYRSGENVILIGPEEGDRLTVDVAENGILQSSDGYTLLPC